MERRKIIIDGMHFSTLEEFYDEIDKLLTKELTWRTGHNMDAFHDLLRGGFGVHEYGEGMDFVWINADKSRHVFGYEATAIYWDKITQKCHPTNREMMAGRAMAARECRGETLFDIIVKQILNKEDVYDHTLCFDEGEGEKTMSITVNIYYSGKDGNARKFAEEMESSGTADLIRGEEGNERYEYFFPMNDPETVLLIDSWRNQESIDAHHSSDMMKTIAWLREKYDLRMNVERFISDETGIPESDKKFIR